MNVMVVLQRAFDIKAFAKLVMQVNLLLLPLEGTAASICFYVEEGFEGEAYVRQFDALFTDYITVTATGGSMLNITEATMSAA